MGLGSRFVVAAVSLGVGTWLGLGRPPVDPATMDRARGLVKDLPIPSAAPSISASTAPPPRAPLSASPPGVTPPSSAPAPRAEAPRPWPRLNPDADIDRAWLLAEGPAQDRRSGKRLVTFTFDDGPFFETTPRVLKLLAQYDVRATFFVVSRYLEGDSPRAVASRAVLADVVRRGHFVGNHTRDHQMLSGVSAREIAAQLDDSAAAIEKVTGARPVLFRPPFGKLDADARRAVAERKLDLVLWSVEVHDMERTDVHDMLVSLKTQLDFSRGGIVLLHDIRPTTVPLLAAVLEAVRAAPYDPSHPDRVGYEVVDLPTYLTATAAAPQPYATREALQKDRLVRWNKLHPKKPAPSDDPALAD